MRLEHYPPEKLKKELKRIIGKHLDLDEYRIFFFGSRVTGKGTDRSDIDVGIEGTKAISSTILESIQEEVEELPTLYKIDIVDFRRLAPKFRKVALQKTENV